MPRKISEMSAEEAEAQAEEAANRIGYELVRIGKKIGYRQKSWGIGVVHASRYDTKLGALDGIIGRMGTKG